MPRVRYAAKLAAAIAAAEEAEAAAEADAIVKMGYVTYVWSDVGGMFGLYLNYAWAMFGLYLGMFGLCFGYGWLCLGYIWAMFGGGGRRRVIAKIIKRDMRDGLPTYLLMSVLTG